MDTNILQDALLPVVSGQQGKDAGGKYSSGQKTIAKKNAPAASAAPAVSSAMSSEISPESRPPKRIRRTSNEASNKNDRNAEDDSHDFDDDEEEAAAATAEEEQEEVEDDDDDNNDVGKEDEKEIEKDGKTVDQEQEDEELNEEDVQETRIALARERLLVFKNTKVKIIEQVRQATKIIQDQCERIVDNTRAQEAQLTSYLEQQFKELEQDITTQAGNNDYMADEYHSVMGVFS